MKTNLPSMLTGLLTLVFALGIVVCLTWHAHRPPSLQRETIHLEETTSPETPEQQAAFWKAYGEKYRKAIAAQMERENNQCAR